MFYEPVRHCLQKAAEKRCSLPHQLKQPFLASAFHLITKANDNAF
jgi:hypothetical protein